MTDSENWLAPSEALRLLKPLGSPIVTADAVLGRLGAGLIRSRAETRVAYKYGSQFEVVSQIDLEPGLWFSSNKNAGSSFWQTSDTPFSIMVSKTEVIYQAFGIRFWKPDVLRMLPSPALTVPSDAPQPTAVEHVVPKGGRPPKPHWEPLLIEMARQLYAGELQPRTQAEVQRAMHDWLTNQGHTAGETQVKGRARLLWEAIR